MNRRRSIMMNVQGSCLCGEVKVTIDELINEVTACHCSLCRKQGAGPIFYTEEVKSAQMHIENEESIRVYQSSDWAERGFCSKCGTFIFYRYQKVKHAHLNVELFKELSKQANFNLEIFYGDKPDYYSFDNITKKEV